MEFPTFLEDIANPIISIYNFVTQNKSQSIFLDATNLCGYAMSKFLPTDRFKWIDPKELDFHKYSSNSPKVCV